MGDYLGKIADNALDSIHESRSAKRELKNDLKRERMQSEQEMKMQRKSDVTEQLSDIESSIHEINFDITNPNSITSDISTLSNLLLNLESIDVYNAQSGFDTSLSERKCNLKQIAEKKKVFGMSMLEAVDPNNPILHYYKSEKEKASKEKALSI